MKDILTGFCGVILYEGPSQIDGAPIVVIANRIDNASLNDKTGAMVQTFILRQDIEPHIALKSGDDRSICGDCPLRPINAKRTRCYVRVHQAPLSTYRAYKRGRYARPGVDFPKYRLPGLFAGKSVRIGSYGDPAAAPRAMWDPVVLNAARITGYTHQWRDRPEFADICMASADSPEDARQAIVDGWRYFRVRKPAESLNANEIVCPASKESKANAQCATCGLCAGNTARAKNIVIVDHGLMRNRA